MSEETINFHLGEKIAFTNIADVYEKLKSIDFSKAKNVELDAEDLEELDLMGLQMLMAFIGKVQKQGAAISWENPTIELFEAATDLGFNAALKL